MTKDEIRKLLEANTPFTIHLTDGRKFQVPHRDFISVPPGSRGNTIIVYGDDGLFNIVNLILIASLEAKEQS
jgi:hypothetical protein